MKLIIKSNTVALMNYRIVFRVDLVASIDVAEDEKRVETRLNKLVVVRCRVRSKQIVLVNVVAVFFRSNYVIFGHEKTVFLFFSQFQI